MNEIISDFTEKGIKWQKGLSRAKQVCPAERNRTTPMHFEWRVLKCQTFYSHK